MLKFLLILLINGSKILHLENEEVTIDTNDILYLAQGNYFMSEVVGNRDGFESIIISFEDDFILNSDGIKIAIDPLSQQFLHGCSIEFMEELGNSYFQISNPNASAKGKFGGDGTGKSTGDGNGENEGIGDGENGPGVKGKIGKLGTGEGKAPVIYNPTKEEGKVAIKITIDRNGKIMDVKVLSNHARTTTNSPALLAKAKKDGFKFKFKPDANRKELTSGIRIINYILQ